MSENVNKNRIAGGQPHARATSSPIFFVVVPMGWLVDEFMVWQIVAMERISSTIASSKKKKSWSASDDPPKADTRAGG